ncbi:MAG TPA: hypothetical protein VGG75_16730 [Trebonia sp.]|jgi:hypothetical protein
MTLSMFSRENRRQRIEAAFASPASIADAVGDIDVPADIAAWLGRLLTLTGVPFQYLVPDEAMLPPESIRFFRLDDNWVRALLDGAFSLGRDLTAQAGDSSTNLDHVLLGPVTARAKAAAPLRPRTGVAAPAADSAGTAWTGFLLRSRVVSDYPGLGVNVYPKGHTPDDPGGPVLTPVRRLDRLGPTGDTLFCLVHGDAYRVDVHEAPELLHYGLDRYTPPEGTAAPTAETAEKELRTFTRSADGTITLGGPVPVDVGTTFRTRSPRVLNLTRLAGALARANATANHADTTEPIDSALLGLVMTEGVGMVSFVNRDAS